MNENEVIEQENVQEQETVEVFTVASTLYPNCSQCDENEYSREALESLAEEQQEKQQRFNPTEGERTDGE